MIVRFDTTLEPKMSRLLLGSLARVTDRLVFGTSMWIRMTMTNNSHDKITVVNPDMGRPPPELNWTASDSAYQIGVLMSLGVIEMALEHLDGEPVEATRLMPWVSPLVSQLVLQPTESISLDIDVSEWFAVTSEGMYRFHVRYGDDALRAEATLDFEVKWI